MLKRLKIIVSALVVTTALGLGLMNWYGVGNQCMQLAASTDERFVTVGRRDYQIGISFARLSEHRVPDRHFRVSWNISPYDVYPWAMYLYDDFDVKGRWGFIWTTVTPAASVSGLATFQGCWFPQCYGLSVLAFVPIIVLASSALGHGYRTRWSASYVFFSLLICELFVILSALQVSLILIGWQDLLNPVIGKVEITSLVVSIFGAILAVKRRRQKSCRIGFGVITKD